MGRHPLPQPGPPWAPTPLPPFPLTRPTLPFFFAQAPCNSSSHACCVGSTCAKWAAGHLRTVQAFTYGTWTVVAQVAHSPVPGAPTPNNAFTCFGSYTDAPVHNEISMCWEATTQSTLGAAYWYSAAEEKTDVQLPFDASQGVHNWTVVWAPSSITWMVDGKVLHTDSGQAGKTIPYEPQQLSLITRPRDSTYDGDAVFTVKSFSYSSAY